MFVIHISNQRSYYYIRIDDLRNIGFVWAQLSKKGFFKLHGYYDLNVPDIKFRFDSVKDSKTYFDSLDEFLKR